MTKQERFRDIIRNHRDSNTIELLEMAYTLALDDLAEALSVVIDEDESEDIGFFDGLERALYEIDVLS